MIALVFLIIFTVFAVGGLAAVILAPRPEPRPDQVPIRAIGAVILFLAVLGFGLVFLLNSFKLVGANEVGVKVTFGSVQQEPLLSGAHWVAPWSEVATLPTRPKTFTTDAVVRSSENGIIKTRMSARWATDKANAADLYLQVRSGDETEIENALLKPNLIGAAGASLGAKSNLDIINGTKWVANQNGVETTARTYLAPYGVTIDTVKIVGVDPDDQTDKNIARASAQVVETNIADAANVTAQKQATRNVTEATGLKDAAAQVKDLTPTQLQFLCLQASERLMNKNTERGIATYVLPCSVGDVRTTTTVK